MVLEGPAGWGEHEGRCQVSKQKCKCGHSLDWHVNDGCVHLVRGDTCACASYRPKRPERKPAPFRRWSLSDTGVAHYDHDGFHTWRGMSEVVELLNLNRVALPKRR